MRVKYFYQGIKGKLILVTFCLMFVVFFGAFLVNEFLGMTYAEGLWWAWTHIIDPGFIADDDKSYLSMFLGSFMVFTGLLVYAGVFLSIFREIIENVAENMQKGSVPKTLVSHTVIASNDIRARYYIDAVKLLPTYRKKSKFVVLSSKVEALKEIKESSPNIFITIDKLWEMTAIKRLSLSKAQRIIILNDFSNDISNIVKLIFELNKIRIKDRPTDELKVYFEINNRKILPELHESLYKLVDHTAKINISLINVEAISARIALLQNPLESCWSENIPYSTVTFVIFGWSDFAHALLQQVLKVGHYQQPTKIIIINNNTDEMQRKVNNDYPGILGSDYIKQVANIECVDEQFFNDYEANISEILTVAVCGADTDEVFMQTMKSASLNINELKQVFTELPDSSGYRYIFTQPASYEYNVPIIPMASCAKAFELMEGLDTLAKNGHDKFLRNRENDGKRLKNSRGGYDNPADYSWDQLEETYREWNRSPFDHTIIKLNILADKYKIVGVTTYLVTTLSKELIQIIEKILVNYREEILNDDMELLAKVEHNRWVGEKLASGWMLGEKTNKDYKVSSFLVSYDELSEEIKQYDRMQVIEQLTNYIR